MKFEEYVTFEQATDLKELGFDIPCYTFYDAASPKDGNPQFVSGQYLVNHNANPEYDAIISAPSLSLVQKWLREKKDIHIVPRYANANKRYQLRIAIGKRSWYFNKSVMYAFCEESVSVGIDKCIELLKSNPKISFS